MPEPCHYCTKPVLFSKHAYDARYIRVNGQWVRLIWHRACDPYNVQTTVTRKGQP